MLGIESIQSFPLSDPSILFFDEFGYSIILPPSKIDNYKLKKKICMKSHQITWTMQSRKGNREIGKWYATIIFIFEKKEANYIKINIQKVHYVLGKPK